ncbi:S41 family peptidase [Actinomadura kijaniata]|uniref:S41 family peptidase n=1 Tax=Actinomadura kijaniata TaxID=46161 RepID=UPI002FE71898
MPTKTPRRTLRGAPVAASLVLLAAPAVPAPAETARPPGGVWRTAAYGQVAVVDGARLRLYQTTSISCLPGGELRSAGPDGSGGVRFAADDGAEMVLRPGPRGGLVLTVPGSVGRVDLRRLPSLPDRCTRPMPKDPRTVFDVFWTTFAEHYPFFAARGVDWNALRARHRPRVTRHTSPDRLFTILSDMIRPLGDAHTGVADPVGGRSFAGRRPGTRRHDDAFRARVDKAVLRNVGVPLRTWADGRVGYADLPRRLGYLRVTAFTGYAGANAVYAEQRAELDRALDAVLTRDRVRALRGLIIDVRYNGGGHDALGVRIASRLTDRPYVAYRKRAPGTAFQTVRVRPSDRPRYTGPVAVLTSDLSVSAAETFTLGLTGRSPAPHRVGATTQGVFSDVLVRALPNGWILALGNEDYRSAGGVSHEGRGVPPTVRAPVFTDAELAAGRDSALARARALLAR